MGKVTNKQTTRCRLRSTPRTLRPPSTQVDKQVEYGKFLTVRSWQSGPQTLRKLGCVNHNPEHGRGITTDGSPWTDWRRMRHVLHVCTSGVPSVSLRLRAPILSSVTSRAGSMGTSV